MPKKLNSPKTSHSTSGISCGSNTSLNLKFPSFAILLLVLLSSFSQSDAEYLCGSKLVNVLDHVCGRRGIHAPSQNRYHRQDHSSRRRSGNQPRITYLCCELGCTRSQLERYCWPVRPSARPSVSASSATSSSPTATLSVTHRPNLIVSSKVASSTRATPNESVYDRSSSPLFGKLASRHKKLLVHNRVGVGLGEGLRRRSSLSEIIKPRTHRDSSEAPVIVADSKFVRAILNFTEANHI